MKKILVLVMSHESDDYVFKNYKRVWQEQINIEKENHKEIKVFFLYSDDSLVNDYQVIDDKLISNCKENYWNSLLIKTLNGFKYFLDSDFDLVFKTNLSTIINYDKFVDYCNKIKDRDYIYDGIIGDTGSYKFCSGAGMLLNKKTVNIVLDNISDISEEWTDDTFIGYTLYKNGIVPYNNGLNRLDLIYSDMIVDSNSVKNHTHIRVKVDAQYMNHERIKGEKDILYTNMVYDILYNKNK